MIPVAIIGAGKVAQGYDKQDGNLILTHVKGFQKHGDFEVVAFCDTNLNKALEAAQRWGIPKAVKKIEDLKAFSPQIISVCVPDQNHFAVLKKCLSLRPKAVFSEKPLTVSPEEGKEIVDEYFYAGVPLCVNYSRRWQSVTQKWRFEIEGGVWGNLQSIRVRYYGGWIRIASHLMDLVCWFFGNKLSGGYLFKKEKIGNFDYRLSGHASLELLGVSVPMYFESSQDDRVAHFEMELVFEKGVLWMGERDGSRFTERKIQENMVYPGYFEPAQSGFNQLADPSEAMKGAVANLHDFLDEGKPLNSTGQTALETLSFVGEILKMPLLK